MRIAPAFPAILAALPASAHPGHVAAADGHSHWLALVLVAVAAALGAVLLARGRRGTGDAEERRPSPDRA